MTPATTSIKTDAATNTDREIWRGPDLGNGDYYADSVHVTKDGGIGINCGGTVIVKTPRAWIAAALASLPPSQTRTPDEDGKCSSPSLPMTSRSDVSS